MNPYLAAASIIETIVRSDPGLIAALSPDSPAWLDVGIPTPSSDPSAVYPCLRLDGLNAMAGKTNTYMLNIHLWSQDMGAGFFTLVDAFVTALQTSNQMLCEQYLHRPETGLNGIVIPVTLYA